MNKDNTIYCNCGCRNGVRIKVDEDDGDVSLELVTDMFNTGGNARLWTIREKIKRIWMIIRNKEYSYFQIIMDKNQVEEFKEFVSKI